MTLAELNVLPRYRAEEEFLKICGSVSWARAMARRRPFANLDRLLRASDEIWSRLDPADWPQAGPLDAEEQHKITRWRLKQLLDAPPQ